MSIDTPPPLPPEDFKKLYDTLMKAFDVAAKQIDFAFHNTDKIQGIEPLTQVVEALIKLNDRRPF
jgi:hypothetical protein